MDNPTPSSKKLFKMNFIYNALINGWAVKQIAQNKYEFTNNNKKIKREFFGEKFIEEFIETNIITSA